jgi:hypothetical protein
LAKITAASAMKPLPGGHMRQEAGRLRDGEIGSAQPAEHAADDDGAIAQPGDRDAGGIDSRRIFADGAQPQAEARPLQHNRGHGTASKAR